MSRNISLRFDFRLCFAMSLNDYYSIWTKNSVFYDRDVKQFNQTFASKARFYCFVSLSANELVI